MIRLIGNRACPDCRDAYTIIEKEGLPVEIHEMADDLAVIKEFLALREGNPDVFEECVKAGSIGIPAYILSDGKITLDTEEAMNAARAEKKKKVILYGTRLCVYCREAMTAAKAEGLPLEFHDIAEDLKAFKAFLKIRGEYDDLYEDAKKNNRVGIPVYVLPDGTVTRNTEEALNAARAVSKDK